MNSFYEYFAAQQKLAAYRQAKRMQRGALTAQGGFSTTDPVLLQVPCTIQSVFVPRVFGSTQTVFDTCGSNIAPRIDISDTGNLILYYGGGSGARVCEIGKTYNIVFAISETSQSMSFNGGSINVRTYETLPFPHYIIGSLTTQFLNKFQGDYLLHRQFNYAMSEEEITDLNNDGDPMGYVVPKGIRDNLIAEYLPQNLMYGRDDKSIATSWLDSAKQLPLSDEYMEPLFQSIGGYDMAANGAPEILYKE